MQNEEILVSVLSDVLKVPVEDINGDCDLLHLGLDSLGTMRAVGFLRKAGLETNFSSLIGKRTLSEWCQQLKTRRGQDTPPAAAVQGSDPDSFDLATMQHAFLVGRGEGQYLGEVSAHYYAEFDGTGLDPDRLKAAVESLVNRHPMLRLKITDDGRQRILDTVLHPNFVVNDLRALAPASAAAQMEVLRKTYSHQRLRIEEGQVLMVALTRLPDDRHRLHIDLDMIGGDALSLRIILRELAQFYQGEHQPVPLRLTYRDYQHERAAVQKDAREKDCLWWQEQLEALPGQPSLPMRASGLTEPEVVRFHCFLSRQEKDQLEQLCRRHGNTVTAAMAALFGETVGLWSGGDPFLLNFPVFARQSDHVDIDSLVGDFSSSVLIPVRPGKKAFSDQVSDLQQELHEGVRHSAYSGVDVLRDLTTQNKGQQILAPVVFTSALGLGDLYEPAVRTVLGEPVWSISQGPQVWLDAQITDYAEGVLINWDVRKDLFPNGMVEEMFTYFERQLDRLLSGASRWQEQLEQPKPVVPLTPSTQVTPPEPENLIDRFFLWAQKTPDAAALVWGTDGTISYGDLALKAKHVAGYLADQGVRPGDTVAITMSKGPEQIIAVLGVLAAGAAYVPCGIDLPPMRRQTVYEKAAVKVVLVDQEDPGEDSPFVLASLQNALTGPVLSAPVQVPAGKTKYIIFTSGSTGEPKGVELSHRSVANTIDAVNRTFSIQPSDRTLTLSELDFDLSAYDVFAFLAYGGSVAVMEENQRRDAQAWLTLIRDWDVNVLSCVPAFLDMLLSAAGSQKLASLRLVMLGGDRILPELAQRWWQATDGAVFAGLGGMTEAAIHSTCHRFAPDQCDVNTVPYGRPLDNMCCRVVDHLGRDCPAWVAGEFWVSGPGVATGYCGDPERTAEKFVTHEGRRWYRSGDYVSYRPDGIIDFLGRIDNQVKIRGHRIELGEIEALLSTHQSVDQVLVTVVDLASRQLCALVTLHGEADPGHLRAWMQERLPKYAVPEHCLIVSDFPLTQNGKIDRKALTGFAEQTLRDHSSGVGTLKTGLEKRVAACWQVLLNVPDVCRQDNFFALGGDSLVATRLMADLRRKGIHGRLADLFASPTLCKFCETLKLGASEDEVLIVAEADKRFEPFDLTDIQRAFWIGRSTEMTLGGVGSHFYIELEGSSLDISKLEVCWRQVVARHDMLRAVVTPDGCQQVLSDTPTYHVRRYRFDEEDAEAELTALREALSHKCHTPERWPLFDIHVAEYPLGGQMRQRVFVSLDSMMLDGRSIMILFTEWDALYRGETLPSLSEGIQYRDYVVQFRHSRKRIEASEQYWRNHIATLPDAPALPLKTAPERISTPRFRRLSKKVKDSVWQRFKERARLNRITPSMALAAAYGEILGYWSNQSSLAINLTLFDRPDCHTNIDRIVGDFASILLLGYHAGDSCKSFAETARTLQSQQADGLSHKELSGVWVMRELARSRGEAMASMPVVFTSVLGLPDDASMELSSGFAQPVFGLTQTPQVWLDAKVSETRCGLSIDWDGVDELFEGHVLDDMFAAYGALVEMLADADWSRPLDLELPASQQARRTKANATRRGERNTRPLYLRFFDQAETTPDAPALVWGQDQTLTYAVLAQKALRVAACLERTGVRPGDRVAVSLPKGIDQIVAVLGVLAAGGCYVPSGIGLPAARRGLVYSAADVKLVLTDDASLQTLAWPEGIPVVPMSACLVDLPLAAPVEQAAEDPKYIIFTSGSTGVPKGVQVSHGAVANTVDAVSELFQIGSSDRAITLSALDFDLSAYDLFAFLSLGGSVAVVPENDRRNAAAWVEMINHWRVSVVSAVPALVEMITIAAAQSGLVSDLRLVMVGGDRTARSLPDALWQLAPNARFASLGGMTEAAIHSTCYEVRHRDPQWACAPYGRPLANMRCRAVDLNGRDCPDWVEGELWVSGAGVADGYFGDVARTAERFVPWAQERWYRTGDLVRYDQKGVLEFLGRADNQVKIRGHRIELAEVEAAIADLPGVEGAAAVLVPGTSLKLGAAVLSRTVPDLEGIKNALKERLPDYEVPEYLLLVDTFPLTSNGKIDRPALSEKLQDHASRTADSTQEVDRSQKETRIAQIWSELLGVSHVGPTDNFFALGGDSLVATRMMARMKGSGLTGSLASLFNNPHLGDFAKTVGIGDLPTVAAGLTTDEAARYDAFTLTDVQEAYWLGRRDDFDMGGIAAQCYVEYDMPGLDMARLTKAWSTLVDRHDMLRCVINQDGQQQIMRVSARPDVAVHRIREKSGGTLDDVRKVLAWRKLSTLDGPLVDINVLLCQNGETRLAILFDNLVVDGLSMLTVLSELFQFYHRPDLQFEPLSIQFRDLVVVKDQQPLSETALTYWQGRLDELPPAPALPLEKDPSAVERPVFKRLQTNFPSEKWAKLTASAQKIGVTPSTLLLASFCEILSRWSGQSALTVNLTLFDRPEIHPDINRVVGDFTSLILASYQADAGEGWQARLLKMQSRIWKDLDHKEVSAVRVLRELAKKSKTEVRPVPVVFTSMLGVSDGLVKSTRWPDLTLSQTPQVWLDHQVIDLPDGLLLSWDYVPELFPADMIEVMFKSYVALLDELLDHDWQDPLIRRLPPAQLQKRQQVNDTRVEAATTMVALHEPFFQKAEACPDKRALRDQNNGDVTYQELAGQALRIAAALTVQGIQRGDVVGVHCQRGALQVAAVLGILAAGAAYVSINVELPVRRKSTMCRKADIKLMISDRTLEPYLEVVSTSIQEALTTDPLNAPVKTVGSDVAYVVFTSGSTGEPKGVEIEHRSALNTVLDIVERLDINPTDRLLGVSSFDFDLSVFDLFGALAAGAELILTKDEQRRDADAWLELMRNEGITVWNSVPALLEMVLAIAAQADESLTSLRWALLSGDWVPPDIARRLTSVAPNAQVIALGGATEASIWSNYWHVDGGPPAGWSSVPYGWPLNNQSFRVVDDQGTDAPDWVPGELWIGGEGVARGYCGDPDKTRLQFEGQFPNRWYRTGDVGRYRPDGALEFLGRRDSQIKLQGHRIELGEIELVLRKHPKVTKAVILLDRSENQAHLKAFAECADAEASSGELRHHLQDYLPSYAVPRDILLLQEWPLTANGKMDRTRLLQMSAVPEQPNCDLAEREAELAALWEDLLGVRPTSSADNFFALGGNSLLGTRLVAQVRERYQTDFSLRAFFADARLSAFTAAIDRKLADKPQLDEGLL